MVINARPKKKNVVIDVACQVVILSGLTVAEGNWSRGLDEPSAAASEGAVGGGGVAERAALSPGAQKVSREPSALH